MFKSDSVQVTSQADERSICSLPTIIISNVSHTRMSSPEATKEAKDLLEESTIGSFSVPSTILPTPTDIFDNKVHDDMSGLSSHGGSRKVSIDSEVADDPEVVAVIKEKEAVNAKLAKTVAAVMEKKNKRKRQDSWKAGMRPRNNDKDGSNGGGSNDAAANSKPAAV